MARLSSESGSGRLADRIGRDLLEKLSRGAIPAEALTLQSLAAHYGVSLTPVREALEALEQAGYLVRGENRRLQIVSRPRRRGGVDFSGVVRASPKSRGGSPAAASDLLGIQAAASRSDHAYAQVEAYIVRLSLEQDASFVREEALAAALGLPRATIRQCFHRLSGQGILEHVPRRGWRVWPFKQSDMNDFTEVRAMLEVRALQRAFPRLDKDRLRQLLRDNRQVKGKADQPIDNSLHRYFVELAGNPYIADFLARHGRYYDLIFSWESRDRAALANAAAYHREILESLLADDLPRACAALERHITQHRPDVQKMVRLLATPQDHED